MQNLPSTSPRYQYWAAYYGADAPVENFKGYDVVVLDAQNHPDIAKIKQQGSKVLAYFSVSEINISRPYADRFVPSIAIDYNDTWNSHVIDIRDRKWQEFITQEWLPEVINQGFDGVFVDTIDSSITAEKSSRAHAGMQDSAIEIVKNIRRNMPKNSLLMVNRGFEILPKIAEDIDIILAESILVDAQKNEPTFFPPHVFEHYVDILQQLKQKHSHLSIFTLDYPKLIDKTSWLHICNVQRNKGFIPYISTKNLQTIVPPSVRC